MSKITIFIIVMMLGAGGATYVLRRSVRVQDEAATQSETVSTVPPPVQQTQETDNTQTEVTTVKYSDAGFEPKQITVKKGTKVQFTNNAQIPMYVATDPHPAHTDYPEFEMGVVLQRHPEPDEDFSFTFDKVGTWKYHNHAMPDHVATVVVE